MHVIYMVQKSKIYVLTTHVKYIKSSANRWETIRPLMPMILEDKYLGGGANNLNCSDTQVKTILDRMVLDIKK